MKPNHLLFVIAVSSLLGSCSKELPTPHTTSSRVTIGSFALSSPFIDYAVVHPEQALKSKLSAFKGGRISSVFLPNSRFQVTGGTAALTYTSKTPGVPVITDNIPVDSNSISGYSKTILNDTYDITLATPAATVPTSNFIRFSASLPGTVVNGNTTLNFSAITTDGLFTIASSLLKPGSIPTFSVTSGGSTAPINFAGPKNGYYYLYITGQTVGTVSLTIPSGATLTKSLTAIANNQFNLIAGQTSLLGPLQIMFAAFNFGTINLSLNTYSVFVTTYAGNGTAALTNGPRLDASFFFPTGVGVDAAGDVFVADAQNNVIRKIDPIGNVTTLAGSGTRGASDGTGTSASFSNPKGLAVDGSGNIYVADYNNNEIRKITPAGVVTTLAGSTTAGSNDGTGAAASFNQPSGVAVDGSGTVYVADSRNNEIRVITPSGVVSTLAGSTTAGANDGTGNAASFNSPTSVVVDAAKNVYVADFNNNEIRKITAARAVTTIAGSTTAGTKDGIGTSAAFSGPYGLAFDPKGNLYVSNQTSVPLVRKVVITASPATDTVITIAGGGNLGFIDGLGAEATFSTPSGLAVDGTGAIYLADQTNERIRRITISK